MKTRTYLSILLTLVLIGCAAINDPPVRYEEARLPMRAHLKVVPLKADGNGCVPAALEMMLKYYGRKIDRQNITEAVQEEEGTRGTDIILSFIRGQGFNTYVFYDNSHDKQRFKHFIHKGYPILAIGVVEGEAHSVVVNGYDELAVVRPKYQKTSEDRLPGTWIICDPGSGQEGYRPYAQFRDFHNMNGAKESFFSMVIYPK